MRQKLIVCTLIFGIILAVIGLPIQRATAQSDSNSSTPPVIDTGDGEELMDDITTWKPQNDMEQAQSALDSLAERRGARADVAIEQTLPRLGMSQCDMNLIRTHQIDDRILSALNYLVTPAEKGGAGMTYLQVTFSKECEQEVPDLIGNAYPVDFPDDAAAPNNRDKGLAQGQMAPNSIASLQQSSIKKSIASLVTSTAHAANVKASDVEPADAQAVHDRGQAVDVQAAGLVMCTTKAGGVFGFGAKITRQAPRPIRVSWQTDKGVAGVQAPFGASFDAMAQTAGLDQFLEGFASTDGTFRAQALDGAFRMMGFNLIASQLGIKPGSFNPETDPLTYNTLGYALLADAMKLPDASVFNPFLDPDENNPNPLVSTHDNVQKLLHRSGLRLIEKDLKLQAGSLQGNTFEEVMMNAGKRRLEQDLSLQPGSFQADITKPEDVIRAIGQAKMDSFFHWPIGTSAKGAGVGSLTDLSFNLSKVLGIPPEKQGYADTVIKGALHLPGTANFPELEFGDSGFWKSDAGKRAKTDLQNVDRQLFPGANGGTKVNLFDGGKINVYDTVMQKSTDNLMYRFITGGLAISDFQTILGVGALAHTYGGYDNNQGSKAFDFPDLSNSFQVDSDGHVTVADISKNNFLLKLIGGELGIKDGAKNRWIALGVSTIAKALNTHPDERYKTETVPSTYQNHTVSAEKISGMVQDALMGQLAKVHFSSAKASMGVSLNPNEFLMAMGATLSLDGKGNSDKVKLLAQRRFDGLVQFGKQQFGDMFNNAADNVIGDATLLQTIARYDKTRPATHPTTDELSVTTPGQTTFHLSQPASSITKISASAEAIFEVKGTLKSDLQTLVLAEGDAARLSDGDKIYVDYVGFAQKGGSNQLTPETFTSLFSDTKALENIALQFGAAKMSTALGLPPNALLLAANLLSPTNKAGIAGIGESALEQAAGLDPGTLTGTLSDAIKNGLLNQDKVNRMFRLEAGWYDKIVARDENFMYYNAVQLYTSDDYYKVEQGSTAQLLTGEITLDQFKKRIGNSQLKYNAGVVLASKFDMHILGYRFTAQDFTDLIDGSYYEPLTRIGARLQEKNRNLPIGALAASVVSGKFDISLWSLGSNFISTAFHLKSIDLSTANSIGDVKSAIGKSAIEQALGFVNKNITAGSGISNGNAGFSGDGPLDVAKNVGVENFVRAYGITIPDSVRSALDQVKFNYHPELAQQARDDILYNFLQGKIGPGIAAEASFDTNTLQRFEAIDRTLGIDKGTTQKFMQYELPTKDYVSKTSNKAVENRVTSDLAQLLGIDQVYAKTIDDLYHDIPSLLDSNHNNDAKAFGDLYTILQKAGGVNFDATLGWNSGTFKHLLDNYNNPLELHKTFMAQGARVVGKFLGLSNDALNNIELQVNKDGTVADYHTYAVAFTEQGIIDLLKLPQGQFTAADTNTLFTGHYADFAELMGAAYMSKSDDMRKAGISYADIKLSIFGDPVKETNYIFDQIAIDNPGMAQVAKNHDQELLSMNNPGGQSYREVATRGFMTEARQTISYKFMDYEVKQLLPGVPIPFGFARAMIGGLYTYIDPTNNKVLNLKGDEARQYMGQLLLVNYLKDTTARTPIGQVIKNVPPELLIKVGDFITGKIDSQQLQNSFTAKYNGVSGFALVGAGLDPVFSKLFGGVSMAPGTSSALLSFAFNGNVQQFQKDIWKSWQFQAFDFADRAIGLKPGTASVMYQGIVGYQQALSSYQAATSAAMENLFEAAATNDIGTFEQAWSESNKTVSSASRQFKTQTAMIITAVANFVFQKQITQVENTLGLKPGTLMYLIQYLIHPDPISLGLFIFFNFIWGGTSTSCEADHYPSSAGGGTPPGVLALETALHDQAASAIDPNAVTSDARATQNPIDKALAPPKGFDGMNNDSYRKGIKASAQYEVRRTIGSLLLMPTRTGQTSLTPIQLGTYSNDDLLLMEKLSRNLYGPIADRGMKGPGTYELITDRIHLGY